MNDSNTKLEAGMMVNVYEDPITCEKLEGRARLYKPAGPLCVTYTPRWIVVFPDDDGMMVERAINPATAHQILG